LDRIQWSAKLMERISTNPSWRHMRVLLETGSLCGLTDRELVDRFVAGHGSGDEADAEVAFEVLVKRHGPMVRRLCRSLLNDHHDADDAFQATFLVLARRAASIRNRDAIASWLCGVAGRVAARARAEARRRRLLDHIVAEQTRHEAIHEPERHRELYEEVARLPERYRAPIVLCYLEGQSHEEAAGILRCRLRTLQTRLQRGKAKLRLRLARRGLAPGAGLLAVAVTGGEQSASAAATAVTSANGTLWVGLSESTARASVQFAAARMDGLASSALGLAHAVSKTLFWNRLRHAAGLAAVLAIGLTLTLFGLAAAVQETARPAGAGAIQEPAQPADTVTIRVLDERGRPISGADVWLQVSLDETDGRLGHGTTDGQGRFLMPVPALWRQQPEGRKFGLVWAHAPAHQIATANAYRALVGKAQSVDLTLGPATDTAFLVLDPEGQAVAGATVEPDMVKTQAILYYSVPKFILPNLRAVTDVGGRVRLPALPREALRSVRVATRNLGIQDVTFADIVESGTPDVKDVVTGPAERVIHLRSTGRILGRIIAERPEWTQGVKLNVITSNPNAPQHVVNTAWDQDVGEAEVVSRADGVFVIPAIAAGQARFRVTAHPALAVLPRIPNVEVQGGATARVEIGLERTVRVRGVIRSRETGEPITGAEILIGHGARKEGERAVSDSQGRFESNTLPGDVTVRVVSTPGSLVQLGDDPLSHRQLVPAGVEAFELPPIEMVRGVTVQGRLVDAANQPIAKASVYADAASGNRQYSAGTTTREGAFTMTLPSGVPLRYRYSFDQGGAPEGLDPVGDARIAQENPLLLRASRGKKAQAVEGQPRSAP
jgi:RNA polymerase sigma factor (sigma-70 family)